MKLEAWQAALRSTSGGARSSVLGSMTWLIACVMSAFVAALKFVGPEGWLVAGGGVLIAGLVVAYVTAYFVCLFKDPDLLRSEKFAVTKMALEKSVVGDSDTGLQEVVMEYDEAGDKVLPLAGAAPIAKLPVKSR